jgi:hypothetical protein
MPIVAMGTTLKKGDVLVANLTSIDGVGVSSDTIETTNLSTEGRLPYFCDFSKRCGRSFNFGAF